MDKLRAVFTFKGRLNRAPYWQGSILLYLGVVVVGFTLMGLTDVFPAAWVLEVALLGLVAVVGASLAVRRCHDRGKSGWWLLAMYPPVVVFSLLGFAASASEPDVGNFFRVLGLPFSIWIFVDIGCLRGTPGPNRFGPDPLGSAPVEVFT